jgi:hypothetical protein
MLPSQSRRCSSLTLSIPSVDTGKQRRREAQQSMRRDNAHRECSLSPASTCAPCCAVVATVQTRPLFPRLCRTSRSSIATLSTLDCCNHLSHSVGQQTHAHCGRARVCAACLCAALRCASLRLPFRWAVRRPRHYLHPPRSPRSHTAGSPARVQASGHWPAPVLAALLICPAVCCAEPYRAPRLPSTGCY